MRQEIYNNQTLIQYLLGSLPAEEVELLDELSISDDEFANSLNGAEDDLVDSYVRGELAGSELAAFRSSYLTSADKHEKVSFAQSLQDFSQRSAAHESAKSAVSLTAAVAGKRDIFNLTRVMNWRIASAMLVLIAVGWFAYYNLRPSQQNTNGRVDTEVRKNTEQRDEVAANTEHRAPQRDGQKPLAQQVSKEQNERTRTEQTSRNPKPSQPDEVDIASLVLTPQMRGVGQLPTISLPAKAKLITVQLQLEPNDYSIYRVALLNESSQVLWRSQKIRAKEKTLSITFPASLLSPSIFVLQVYGIETDRSETLSAYPFKVE